MKKTVAIVKPGFFEKYLREFADFPEIEVVTCTSSEDFDKIHQIFFLRQAKGSERPPLPGLGPFFSD